MTRCSCRGGMAAAGSLNRRITLRAPDAGQDDFGQPLTSYHDVASIWANYAPSTLREYVASRQAEGQIDAVFTILWRGDILNTWVIVYDGKIFDIQSSIEIGMREGLEIRTRARQA